MFGETNNGESQKMKTTFMMQGTAVFSTISPGMMIPDHQHSLNVMSPDQFKLKKGRLRHKQ